MLKIKPYGHPDDPEVIGIEEWTMRQTPAAIFAILRYLYDWEDAYSGDWKSPGLIGRLIDDPLTDFGIIAMIFWSSRPGNKIVHSMDAKFQIHRHILHNFELGYWPESKIPLLHSLTIHAKIEYLDALLGGENLPWIVPHRFFKTFPGFLPRFDLDVRPEEREAFHWFAQAKSLLNVDYEQELKSDLKKARMVGEELGLVSANFALTDHLAFVRDAVRKTGPVDQAAQVRAAEKTRQNELNVDSWAAISRIDFRSRFHQLHGLYHFFKIRRKRHKRKELPQSPIKALNRLSAFQQSVLAIVFLALWVWLSVRTVNWISGHFF